MSSLPPEPRSLEVSPEELLRRLREDDVGALDLVLQQHWGAVVSYLTRWLESRDAAEDIAQQTFIRLWENRASWSVEGSLRGLLFRIARNLAISQQRSHEARERAGLQFVSEKISRLQPTPLDDVVDAELGRALDRAIGALPERRREVFVLRCIHGLSYSEIAATMNISEQTVANQLSRALSTLRSSLAHLLQGD